MVFVNEPLLGKRESEYVTDCIRTGWISSTGRYIDQFENQWAAYCGRRYGIGVSNGTAALHAAVACLRLHPGDEVILPTFTIISCALAVVYSGAIPVLVDCDPRTWCMEVEQVEQKINGRTRAIMPVHLYGHPFDVDATLAVCRKHKLPLVEDAAQAHGAKYKGKTVGTFGGISCFSFYPGKNLGACGEGGALVTDNAAFDKRARGLREHGSTVRYYHDEVGYNYRMEGIQGATLGVKLKHLPKWTAERRRVAHRYHELLDGTPLQLPREAAWGESVYHLYVVRHPRRDDLKKHLEANGIGCALHYPLPLHLQKCYANLGHKPGDFPVAERAARECLSLPIYPELTDTQIRRVAEVVKDFFHK